MIKLSIRTENGDDGKDIELLVNSLNLNIAEVGGYAFSIKATNFSSNTEIQNTDLIEVSNNFDWKNGGLKFETKEDGSIEKYICVRRGTRMYIDYDLFHDSTTDKTDAGGKTFKFAFKATNCYDYDADVLSCYHSGSDIGLKVKAQSAELSTKHIKKFDTQYYEDTYIELETEIWPNVTDKDDNRPGDRFIMFWIDLMGSRAQEKL